jgi:hypothetical protein
MASYSSLFGNGYSGGLQKPRTATSGVMELDNEQTVRQAAPAQPAPQQPAQPPAQQPAQPPAPQQPKQTFAQMQAAGQARPAPPQPQVQMVDQQASATGMGQMTPMGEIPRTRTMPTGTPFAMPAIPAMPGATPAGAGMPGTPSAPQPPAGAPAAPPPQPMPQNLQQMAFEQMRQASRSDLESQFASQRQALEEDLARRGLAASTIGAAGIGRLGGEQARALSQLDAQLLQQQANQAFEAQQAAEQRAFAGGESALERALRQQMQAAGFGQEADILSRQQQFMGGESAADRAARERLQLLGYGQEADMLRRQQEFAGGESELERSLRERLQTGAQTFESGQSALERALRERLQGQQIGESQADRALRERMGLADITGMYGGQETMAARQFAAQQEMARNQMLTQLAGLMAGGSPEMLQMVLGRFGLGGSTTPTTTATATGPIGTVPPAPMPSAPEMPAPNLPVTGGGSTTNPLEIPLGTGTQAAMSPLMFQQLGAMFNPYNAYGYGVM